MSSCCEVHNDWQARQFEQVLLNQLIYSNKKASDIVLCKCDMNIIIKRVFSLWEIIVVTGRALTVSNAEIISLVALLLK
jgi:hypothetical protein